MDSSEYRSKASRALRLANAMGPGIDADRLKLLAAEYLDRASGLDASISGTQPRQAKPERSDD